MCKMLRQSVGRLDAALAASHELLQVTEGEATGILRLQEVIKARA